MLQGLVVVTAIVLAVSGCGSSTDISVAPTAAAPALDPVTTTAPPFWAYDAGFGVGGQIVAGGAGRVGPALCASVSEQSTADLPTAVAFAAFQSGCYAGLRGETSRYTGLTDSSLPPASPFWVTNQIPGPHPGYMVGPSVDRFGYDCSRPDPQPWLVIYDDGSGRPRDLTVTAACERDAQLRAEEAVGRQIRVFASVSPL